MEANVKLPVRNRDGEHFGERTAPRAWAQHAAARFTGEPSGTLLPFDPPGREDPGEYDAQGWTGLTVRLGDLRQALGEENTK